MVVKIVVSERHTLGEGAVSGGETWRSVRLGKGAHAEVLPAAGKPMPLDERNWLRMLVYRAASYFL
jgi:uncharacterized membrane protein